jgi:hypothetical protein
MRRSHFAVAAIAVVAMGCQDHQQPLAPSTLQIRASVSSVSEHPEVWILGRTYTLPSGTQCTFVEQDGQFGTNCGGTFLSWRDFEFNNGLYPVVEICPLDQADYCMAVGRNSYVRKAGEITSSEDRNDSNDKYVLQFGSLPAGRYRVIVAITFTGVDTDGVTRIPAWDHTSDKVLGHYEFSRNSSNPSNTVQFRIRTGALCEGDGQECVETSFDPNQENTLVFDTDYNLTEGEGIVGLKFPQLEHVDQQKINIIVERIRRLDERCIESSKFANSGFTPGRELEPCYSIRTEPYIDLATLALEDPIRFGVCLEDGAIDLGNLLKMLKWSPVKRTLTNIRDESDGSFFECPEAYNPNYAAMPATGTSSLARAAGRLLSPLAALLRPQPAYASVFTVRSPANGSLMDFSTIVVQVDDHYDPVFLSPIGAASSDLPNLGSAAGSVTVELCWLNSTTGSCATEADGPLKYWVGTAVWNATAQHYQVNWNTPRDQARGTYRLTLSAHPYIQITTHEINVSFEDGAKFSHNAGRTLPIKFFLTTAQ